LFGKIRHFLTLRGTSFVFGIFKIGIAFSMRKRVESELNRFFTLEKLAFRVLVIKHSTEFGFEKGKKEI